ncbi:MAG: siderophore-interacting protein [Actinomycetota bacterium]
MTTPAVTRTPRHDATVLATRALTPRMRRVTVAAPSLVGVHPRPSQDVELILAEPTGRRVKRRYTISSARPALGEFDLDVLLHGPGLGATWGAQVKPGDAVQFFGPRGRLELSDAWWHLFAGDESALPAIASLVAALPSDHQAVVLLEVAGPDDELPISRPGAGADVRWLHRGNLPPGQPGLLAAALDELPTRDGTGHAYVLGETRAGIALRPHLGRLGLGTAQTYLKGYWNIGRSARQ